MTDAVGPGTSEVYQGKLAQESKKWGDHLAFEASGAWRAWIDHPVIRGHYEVRRRVDGLSWHDWVRKHLGHTAERSLDLGCGSGLLSIRLFERGVTAFVAGQDISEARIDSAQRMQSKLGIPGHFEVADANTITLLPRYYDLVVSCHSFHHFLKLEHIMEQVHQSLTPDGLFILEEYVGPSQFQWTDKQMDVTRSLLALMPERLRYYENGILKAMEGRPTVEQVVAVSPFESIRSAEIVSLFRQYFDLYLARSLGGTIQHLLYNGIAHNFLANDEEARNALNAVMTVEDALIDSGILPSDFMLLIGKRRKV